MRGADTTQEALFSTVHLDTFVPVDHPLRAVRAILDEAMQRLDGLFNLAYAPNGKASIAPEKLLRALMLQVFYSIRSERALMEQVQYNLLFRWFIGLSIDDTVWSHSGKTGAVHMFQLTLTNTAESINAVAVFAAR